MAKKNLIILLFFIALWGCEEIPNEVIDLEAVDYSIEGISAPDIVVYSETNPKFSTSITIENSEKIRKVWSEVYTINGVEKIGSVTILESIEITSKRKYIGEVLVDENLLSDTYVIYYYVEDNVRTDGENVKKVGIKEFQYLSIAKNFPPVISDLDLPLEVDRNIKFSIFISATDPNGLSDIETIYYQLTDPSGNLVSNSKGISKFPMFDDGNTDENSDVTANNGIYSVYLIFPSSVQAGNWGFTFNAEDKAGSVSNTITSILKVN